jgi:predicted transcriptional regulator
VEETSDKTSQASELFMELASETRLSILTYLNERPAKLSSLSREVNTTVQDVYRNLNRLVEEGLVRRSTDSMFHLTEYGMIVMKQIPDFMFMKENKKFFDDHSLVGVISDKFVQRIGALYNCKKISSVTAVMERLKKLESSTKKQLRIMVSQGWAEEGRIIVELSMHGIQVQSIVGKNTIMPKEIIDSIRRVIEKMPTTNQNMQTKMIEKIDVALYISDEQEAAVMFPNVMGEIDMSTIFIGSDPVFYEWCSDLFNHYWESGGYFDVRKTIIV